MAASLVMVYVPRREAAAAPHTAHPDGYTQAQSNRRRRLYLAESVLRVMVSIDRWS